MDAETKWIFLVLTLGLPGLALNSRWVLQGERQFGRAALLDVVTTGTQLLAAMALVAGPGDTLWAATALTLATWVTSITSIVVAGRWDRFRPHVDRRLPTVIHQGIPLGAAAVAIAIYYSVDTVLLGVFRSAEEVAFYAAAYRVILPILALAGAVGIVAIPHLTLLATRDAAQANQATADISRWLMLLALPLAAGGSLAAGPIVRFIYGNEFAPAAAPFAVLVWSVVTVFANAAFAFLMLARRGDRRYLVAATAGAGTNFGLNLIAIPAAGMLGAAFTTILSEVIVLGCILYWTRDVSIKALIAGLRPPAVPTLAMCVILWPIRESGIAVPVGAVVYCLVAALTGAHPFADLVARSRRLLVGRVAYVAGVEFVRMPKATALLQPRTIRPSRMGWRRLRTGSRRRMRRGIKRTLVSSPRRARDRRGRG